MTDDTPPRTAGTRRIPGHRLASHCANATSALRIASADYPGYVKRCIVTGTPPVPHGSLERSIEFMSALTLLMAIGGTVTITSPDNAQIMQALGTHGLIPEPEPGDGRI